MSDRLVVDVDCDGLTVVSRWPVGGSSTWVAGPAPLTWPLTAGESEDLRWYLEDYLDAPFGVYEQRAPRIAAELAGWRRRLVDAVFAAPAARAAYEALSGACADGRQPRLLVRCAEGRWLNRPWELLAGVDTDGSRARPSMAVSRCLRTAVVDAGVDDAELAVGMNRLRVLVVIARPRTNGDDAGYRVVARRLVERCRTAHGAAELTVLRPPTLAALADALSAAQEAGEPFGVVHFDGHGAFSGLDDARAGWLVFEGRHGQPVRVSAEAVAEVLGRAEAPVVVLNACRSGTVEGDVGAGVATGLLRAGVASVVAMAYSVLAVTAAEFIAEFYGRLFAGDAVDDAVAAGRAHLARQSLRPSLGGPIPLADWIVPVHYRRREVRFPALRAHLANGALADAGQDDGFVGRDREFQELEGAARRHRVILVHGNAGTGKTELAAAFGRWWCDTGALARPERVVWCSLAPGAAQYGVEGVVAAIGQRLGGTEFALLETDAKHAAAIALLADRPALLVLDNFESVHSMPDPATVVPPLAPEARTDLVAFLAEVRASGRATVLLTSRSREAWLGEVERVELAGLTGADANEYADRLLAPWPEAAPRRRDRAFGELMHWLDGHPMCMRLALPLLASNDAATVLQGLRGRGEGAGAGGDLPLAASIAYSMSHLDAPTRSRLVVLSLFRGTADVDVLSLLSHAERAPARLAGAGTEIWRTTLHAAAKVGLLRSLGADMYRIHPALPAQLAAQWRADGPAVYAAERDAAEVALRGVYVEFLVGLSTRLGPGGIHGVLAVLDEHIQTLGEVLGRAIEDRAWSQVLVLIQAASALWEARGQPAEQPAWIERIRLGVESAYPRTPEIEDSAGTLWRFLAVTQSALDISVGRLDEAQAALEELHADLAPALPSTVRDGLLSAVLHGLGRTAHARGNLDEAERWYASTRPVYRRLGFSAGEAESLHHVAVVAQDRGDFERADELYRQALTIRVHLDDLMGVSATLHQLGVLAQRREHLDEAEQLFGHSLGIDQTLGNLPGVASSLHALARVAHLRGDWDTARRYFADALGILEQTGDRAGRASIFGALGDMALARGALEEAQEWMTRSGTMFTAIGDPLGVADSWNGRGKVAQARRDWDEALECHGHAYAFNTQAGNRKGVGAAHFDRGMVEQKRKRFNDARAWYERSLAVDEEIGDRQGAAATHGQLGCLAEELGDLPLALRHTVICFVLLLGDQEADPGPGPEQLVRITRRLGLDELRRSWHEVTGEDAPEVLVTAVRHHV